MKAKDLIKELQKFHPEARVVIIVPEYSESPTEEKPVDRVEPLGCNQFEIVIK